MFVTGFKLPCDLFQSDLHFLYLSKKSDLKVFENFKFRNSVHRLRYLYIKGLNRFTFETLVYVNNLIRASKKSPRALWVNESIAILGPDVFNEKNLSNLCIL